VTAAVATSPPSSLSDIAVRYERLRQAALGAPLPPDARQGLLLFLRRGMWAWARAVTIVPTTRAVSARAPSSGPILERTAIIHILAAMALTSAERSVP
jgi:hypothetical protein